jgi:hypothetical protein
MDHFTVHLWLHHPGGDTVHISSQAGDAVAGDTSGIRRDQDLSAISGILRPHPQLEEYLGTEILKPFPLNAHPSAIWHKPLHFFAWHRKPNQPHAR